MFKLNLLTPEKKVFVDQEISEIAVPTVSGEVDILPGHVPMIATLGTGVLKFKTKGEERVFKAAISWGYCEVTPAGVNVLAEFVQLKEDVNEEKAKQQIAAAQTKLGTQTLSDEEFAATEAEAQKGRAGLALLH